MARVLAVLFVFAVHVHAFYNRLLQTRAASRVPPTVEPTQHQQGAKTGGDGAVAAAAITTGRGRRLKLLPTAVAQDMDAIAAAFIGGTVGVMSVAVMVEMRKKSEDNTLESCPYCMGNGEILCASCFGMCTTTAIGRR